MGIVSNVFENLFDLTKVWLQAQVPNSLASSTLPSYMMRSPAVNPMIVSKCSASRVQVDAVTYVGRECGGRVGSAELLSVARLALEKAGAGSEAVKNRDVWIICWSVSNGNQQQSAQTHTFLSGSTCINTACLSLSSLKCSQRSRWIWELWMRV